MKQRIPHSQEREAVVESHDVGRRSSRLPGTASLARRSVRIGSRLVGAGRSERITKVVGRGSARSRGVRKHQLPFDQLDVRVVWNGKKRPDRLLTGRAADEHRGARLWRLGNTGGREEGNEDKARHLLLLCPSLNPTGSFIGSG